MHNFHFLFDNCKIGITLVLIPGTLTHGKPVVIKHEASYTDNFLLLVGSAEMGSEHVLGKAIVKYAQGKCKLKEARNFEAYLGKVCSASMAVFVPAATAMLTSA